jgi:hypothetical protein
MRNVRIALGSAGLLFAVNLGWQLAACELTKVEFQDDLHDLAAQVGTHIGLPEPSTDDELRSAVIDYAKKYGIHLEPSQVIIERSGTVDAPKLYLAAPYQQAIKLPGYSFVLDFTVSSVK